MLKRLLSWKSILLFSALVFACLMGIVGYQWYATGNAVKTKLAELRSQGLPTNLRQLNAFYKVPDGVTDTTELWKAAFEAIAAANLVQRGQSLPIVGTGPTPIPAPGEEWAEQATAEQLLSELDAELELIRAAGSTPGQYRWPGLPSINTQRPDMNLSREVARLLVLDAHVAAHSGDKVRALDDLKIIFTLQNSMRGETFLISQLVRNAIALVGYGLAEDLLPYVDWTDAQLVELQQSLLETGFQQSMIIGLQGERALSLEMTKQFPFFRGANQLDTLNYYQRSIGGFQTSWTDALEVQEQIDKEIAASRSGRTLQSRWLMSILMLPATKAYVLSGARSDARRLCLIVAIAAQRHRLRNGNLPSALTEIDEDLLVAPPETFIDPVDGAPIRFKSTESELRIYSIGRNKVDNAANFEVDSSTGESFDWGVSVPK